MKNAGDKPIQTGQRSRPIALEVRYEYRGNWKDIYLGDVTPTTGDRRCLVQPGSKVCVHFRARDLDSIRCMSRPAGVPVQLWQSLVCNNVHH
ncbi:MAG: hypothetical protein AB4040_05320 [Synechococcus sp.]